MPFDFNRIDGKQNKNKKSNNLSKDVFNKLKPKPNINIKRHISYKPLCPKAISSYNE